MESNHSLKQTRADLPKRTHLTTVVLEERDDGRWRATQTGVDVEGTGDSAAEAATEYCAKIAGETDAA